MSAVFEVATDAGPGRFHVSPAEEQHALLVLGHGAGGGVTAADLELLARRLPAYGVTVLRYEQPWRVAGRRIAVAPPRLDEAWIAGIAWLQAQEWAVGPLVVGGRSAGARVACRTADRFGAAGVVCLAFPLHLPGRPEKSRIAELTGTSAPRLVLQGTNDSFGGADEVAAAVGDDPGVRLVPLPGADHAYRVAKASPFTPADLRAALVDHTTAFLAEVAGIPEHLRR